jgi:hypothetical protein
MRGSTAFFTAVPCVLNELLVTRFVFKMNTCVHEVTQVFTMVGAFTVAVLGLRRFVHD